MSSNISFYPKATNKQNWIQLTIDFTIDTVAVLDASIERNFKRLKSLILLKRLNSFYAFSKTCSKTKYLNFMDLRKKLKHKVDKSFILAERLHDLRFSNVS